MHAKAKVNLFLHVVGKREDGYHLLESAFVYASDIYDEIDIQSSDDFKLTIKGEFAALLNIESDNIVSKTARLVGISNCHINLTKNLPIAGGVGGGSSDAATTLKLLIEQRNLQLSDKQIKDICIKLGADVYPCYYDQASYVYGIGDIVESIISFPTINALLVNPKKAVLTKDIFNARENIYRAPIENKPLSFNNVKDLLLFLSKQTNDLEDTTKKLLPEIDQMLNIISAQPGCLLARMSGSGATCFGIFSSQEEVQKAAQIIKASNPKWWVKPTRLS
jgi:4-diphosphocytidyl-2-C-methyl-D-erythritol kinase